MTPADYSLTALKNRGDIVVIFSNEDTTHNTPMPHDSPVSQLTGPVLPESKSESILLGTGGSPANEPKYVVDAHSDTLEQACIALLSSRVFGERLSDVQADRESLRVATRVKHALKTHGECNIELDDASRLLNDRIAFTSRGKRLHHRGEDLTPNLALVTQAMLTSKCLTAQYNHRTRELHPHGIVVREPKIYILATETTGEPSPNSNVAAPPIKQYLLNRFAALDISTASSSVAPDFSISDHINAGHMDVSIPVLEHQLGPQFELVMRINDQDNDALMRDLQDFSLDNHQKAFINTDEHNNCLLTVPNQSPTYALTEWILGRTDRVEVIAPAQLRQYLFDRLNATCKVYSGNLENPHEQPNTDELDADNEIYPEERADTVTTDVTPRSSYASSTKKNRVVAKFILRILNEIHINHTLLSQDNTWRIDPIFDGDVIAYINQDDVAGFKDWIYEQAEKAESEELDSQDPLLVNIHDAVRLLSLSEVESDLLCLAALVHQNPPLISAFRLMSTNVTEHDAIDIVSTVLRQPVAEVAHALEDSATLRMAGLVGRCPVSIESVQDLLKIPDPIATNLFNHHKNSLGLLSGLTVNSPAPELTDDDFYHLAEQITMTSNYLKGATENKISGCNILLWGAPGTGKTQLARLLTSQLPNISSWDVMATTSNGKSMNELERMSSYQLIQSVLGGAQESAIIFDEVENILQPSFSTKEAISKAALNHVLENNPIPSIWISNCVKDIDPAYLRRFDLVFEIPVPAPSAKKLVAQRILDDIPFNGELLDTFLKRREVGPAFLRKVRRVAQLTGSTTEQSVGAVATNLLNNEIALKGGAQLDLPQNDENTNALPSLPYDSSMINASEDIGALASTLQTDVNVKFCLYGPPGTGKTAWARQLAKQMKKPAHVVQAADIQDKYNGESERKIVKAFDHAEVEGAVLIFDEVDTFLSKRSTQQSAYSVSTTNQFLTSLENYKGLVVCSTNLMDNMDSAALRRFDFKVNIKYLTASQANQMLVNTARVLDMELNISDVIEANCGLSGDTYAPGDFAVVLKRSQIRTGEVTLAELHTSVIAEAEIRGTKANNRRVGFV